MRRCSTSVATTTIAVSILFLLLATAHLAAQDAVEVRLGAFLPVSGISADVGAQMKGGIEVAVERAQQSGIRIGDRPARIRVIWYDDEGKGDVGLNVVTRALTVDKVHIAVGFVSSDVFLRVMDEFQKSSTPAIACCASSLNIRNRIVENKMTHVFQLSPRLPELIHSLTSAVMNTVKPQKIAFLNENTDVGRDIGRLTRQWLQANALGVEVVAEEFIERGTTDLTPQLAKIKRSGAQAILGEIYGSNAPVYYTQWFELRVPAVIVHGGGTVSAQDFIDKHHKLMEGSLILNRWWPARYSEVSEPMMASYTKRTGRDPTQFAVQAHDAALVALDAIGKAGSLDPERVRATLESASFVTAWGTRKFTPLSDGHGMPIDAVVVQVQGGKKVPIYPAAVAASAGGKFAPVPPFAWEKK